MKILLDNGHGRETAGKRSPVWGDGSQLFEWEFNRDIVRRVARGLAAAGMECVILIPEDKDIPLPERVGRANTLAAAVGGEGAMLVSVHANAGGGTGWEAFTSPGITMADCYASIFYDEAARIFPDQKIRKGDASYGPGKKAGFYILTKSVCPAVLTENFFMDTEEDCRLIMSEEGREKVALLHVEAIIRCVEL